MGAALTVGGCLRLEPEHDPAASPEFEAAAKLRLRFRRKQRNGQSPGQESTIPRLHTVG